MVFVHMRMANYYHKKMRARNDFNIYDKTDYVQVAFRNASITYQVKPDFKLCFCLIATLWTLIVFCAFIQ